MRKTVLAALIPIGAMTLRDRYLSRMRTPLPRRSSRPDGREALDGPASIDVPSDAEDEFGERRRPATDVFFAVAEDGHPFSITVEEDPRQIHAALVAAGGDRPFALTEWRTQQTVYVNPRTIAYWKTGGDTPASPAVAAAAASMWSPR